MRPDRAATLNLVAGIARSQVEDGGSKPATPILLVWKRSALSGLKSARSRDSDA